MDGNISRASEITDQTEEQMAELGAKVLKAKALTELLGKRWLEEDELEYRGCCGTDYRVNLDFSTWEGFGKLWEFCCAEYEKPLGEGNENIKELMHTIYVPKTWIKPDDFATLVYNHLKLAVGK